MSHNTDNIFVRLADRWSLSCDKNQWILMQRTGKDRWEARYFIASEKQVLERILREEGVTLTPEAEIALLHMPERFLDWFQARERPLAVAAE